MLNYNPLASAKYELVNLKYGLESYQMFTKQQMQHFYDVALQARNKKLNKRIGEKKMEFIIDTVNLEDIKEAVEYMPIVGVTSNPSIVKKTSPKDFFKHMKEVRKIIGKKEVFIFKSFQKNVMKSLKKPIVY